MSMIKERLMRLKLLRLAVFFGILGYAWVALPAIHDARHLCPVRPDGIREADAIPSFARQTGMSCSMCHTAFPELTPFGRRFKLNGYTLTTKPADISDYSVSATTQSAKPNLVLSYVSPLSVAVQSSYAKWSRAPLDQNAGSNGVAPTAQAQGDTFLVPDQINLFYAGRVTDDIGTWLMLTYDGTSGSVGIDNSEVRYAKHSDDRRWVWGTFANNTPGMQDVYNTADTAFGVPLFNVPSLYNQAPGGGLTGPITGNLAGNSVGVGEYAFYDDSLYAEASLYHAGTQGSVVTDNKALQSDTNGAIDGVAPRVRLAYEYDRERFSGEAGAMGMQLRHIPGGIGGNSVNSPKESNDYLVGAMDFQLQYLSDDSAATLMGSQTYQRQSNNPAYTVTISSYTNNVDYLDQTSITAEYYYRRRYGGLVNWVNTTGTRDAAMNGGDFSPENQYWVFELDYMPWLNTKFLLQYDLYSKVNGTQSPFSSVSTKPSDNNTFVAGLWMAF